MVLPKRERERERERSGNLSMWREKEPLGERNIAKCRGHIFWFITKMPLFIFVENENAQKLFSFFVFKYTFLGFEKES